MAVNQDITEQRRMELELISERDFSKSLIETAQTVILVLNPDGTINFFNPYMEKISGYTLEEVQGKDWFETFLPNQDWKAIREVFNSTLAFTKAVVTNHYSVVFRMRNLSKPVSFHDAYKAVL